MLNKAKGNMYDFVTHTWNPIKGKCQHGCSYCYMSKWGKQNPVRFDEKELKTDLGNGNFIFVGSSCDMFAEDIPAEWIIKTLDYCNMFDNHYLFQSKNPGRFLDFKDHTVYRKSVFCTTIESNVYYPEIMNNSPNLIYRACFIRQMSEIAKVYVTIEPVMKFVPDSFVELIKLCNAEQVNIGADSGGNHLPEPTSDELKQLICRFELFTKVKIKKNLGRLLR